VAAEEEAELQEAEIVDDPDSPPAKAAPPPRRLTKPPLPASAEARETIRAQEEVIASLRGELSRARSDLALRSVDLAQAQMEHATEKRARAADVANHERLLADRDATQRVDLEELANAHARAEASVDESRLTLQQRVEELEATLASERAALTDSVRGHSRALSAAKTSHGEYEHALAAERAAHTSTRALLDSAEAAMNEKRATLQGELSSQQRERKAAEARAQRAHAEHETVLARLRTELTRVEALEKELASTKDALTDAGRAIERAQQDAIKEELARDAASHDANARAMQAQEEAVRKAREQADREREELVRTHERSLVTMRDEAVAKALQVLKARRKVER
jgi:hypothetical protein